MRNLFIKYLQNKTLWHYTTKNLRCIGYICTLCRRNYKEVKEFKKKTKSTNKLWIEAQILMRNIIYCLLPWICVVLKISVQIAIQCHFIYFLQSSGIPWKKISFLYMNRFIECLNKFHENSFSFACSHCAQWNEDQRKKKMGNLNFFLVFWNMVHFPPYIYMLIFYRLFLHIKSGLTQTFYWYFM